MHRLKRRVFAGLLLLVSVVGAQNPNTPGIPAAHTLSWQEAVSRFRSNNPTLAAGEVNIQEARASEITAYLRPNPVLQLELDQITAFHTDPYQPLAYSYPWGQLSYLHERQHKRELRLESAQRATGIATFDQRDLERNLLFNLRDAFNRVLLAKAIQGLASENLQYYDKLLAISQDRFKVGAIARVDFQRVELQRIQFEADLQTAEVNVRTAKIDLMQLLRDRSPVESFDVQGTFDFEETSIKLDDLRAQAISTRPDLLSARASTDKARTDYQLAVSNGSTDPTFSLVTSHQPPPYNTYVGLGVTIPLRIFDRNQGEKLRTKLDIGRNERLQDAAEIDAVHDVDAGYATLESTAALLRPYKSKYLKEAVEVRDTVSFAYEKGAASLLDFLDAQREYRATQLSYLNLLGAYYAAVNQVNLAVGREVIP